MQISWAPPLPKEAFGSPITVPGGTLGPVLTNLESGNVAEEWPAHSDYFGSLLGPTSCNASDQHSHEDNQGHKQDHLCLPMVRESTSERRTLFSCLGYSVHAQMDRWIGSFEPCLAECRHASALALASTCGRRKTVEGVQHQGTKGINGLV